MNQTAVVRIDLPANEGGPYDAIVCEDGEAELALAVARFGDRPRFLVADERVAQLHGRRISRALGSPPIVLVPEGEACKSMGELERAAAKLVELGVRRDAVLFGLGGGAACDLVGFLAATLLRGLDHVLVPSTVLGMVDAAIGGKTAVNLSAGKNLVGAFHQPRLVVCDLALLSTLPVRDRHAGLAEVLKHALLEGPEVLAALEAEAEALRDAEPARLFEVVRRAIAFKASVVAEDPKERSTGKRDRLNLGHTIGHALETASHAGPSPLRHGEAVALGLLAEARIGAALGKWPEGPARLGALLPRLGLPVELALAGVPLSSDVILGALRADKKRDDDRIRFVLLDEPGHPVSVTLDGARAVEMLLSEKRG